MVSKKLLKLTNLSRVQICFIYKIIEIIIIYEDKKFIFTIFWVMISSFEFFNTSKKFAVMSFILYFYKNYIFKKNATRDY